VEGKIAQCLSRFERGILSAEEREEKRALFQALLLPKRGIFFLLARR